MDDYITPEHINKYLSGRDSEGDPKSVAHFAILHITGEDNVKERASFSAVPDIVVDHISFLGDFVMVQFDFIEENNMWLRRLHEMLDEFHKIPDKSADMFSVSIVNLLSEINYYLNLMNPLTYTFGFNDKKKCTRVQMLFHAGSVNAIVDEFNMDAVKAEFLRDMEAEEIADEVAQKLLGTPDFSEQFLGQVRKSERTANYRESRPDYWNFE